MSEIDCKIFFRKYVCNHCKETIDFDCEQCQKYTEYLKIEKSIKQLQQLKAENEDLKEKLEQAAEYIKTECTRCALTNKLEQCLDEIKGIVKQFCNACQEFEPEKSINCMYCNCGKILQKIKEVKK